MIIITTIISIFFKVPNLSQPLTLNHLQVIGLKDIFRQEIPLKVIKIILFLFAFFSYLTVFVTFFFSL